MFSENLNTLSKEIVGPVPFWFLNSPITREQVAKDLDMLLDRGIREVVIHPRYGLGVEYPADAWFEVFSWCIEEARRRGMFIWIYDELNWPSGTAGMTVQANNPDLAGKYLAVTLREENGAPQFAKERLLIAARIQGGRITKTSWIRDESALNDLGPGWKFFECDVRRDKYYIDTLSKAAVDAFKESTYEEYYRRFGDEFGKTIRAIFTDEPSVYWVSIGYDDWNLPYTEALFPTFVDRYGYAAEPLIPYLFYQGRDASAFRADFWEHVSRLFSENYYGNLGDWCRKHGIIFTGHTHHEEPIRYQIRFTGDIFGSLKQMDAPGIDHLGKTTLGNYYSSVIAHKIVSSIAHHQGKARVMSESFGLTDWDVTFLDLKKIVDWQFALGVNLLIPHALFNSVAGPRKRESPPSFFHQSPQWEDFDAFAAYVDRLQEAMTGGRHVCRTLILYPLTSLWAAYQTDRRTEELDYQENVLNTLCLELMKFHIDFDFVDFATLQTAKINDGKIRIADEAYDAFIAPPVHFMRPEEQRGIERIANAGVITCVLYRSGDPADANRPSRPKMTFVPTEDMTSMAVQLAGLFDKDMRLSGRGHEDVMLLCREKDGRRICFVANRADARRRVLLILPGRPAISALAPEDGRSVKLSSHRRDGQTETVLALEAHESLLLNIGPGTPSPVEAHEPERPIRKIPCPELRVSIPHNVALLFNFQFTPTTGTVPSEAGGLSPLSAVDVRENPVFIPVNWDSNPPDFTTGAGEYVASLDVDVDPAGLRLVLDGEYADHELYVNGRRAHLKRAMPHLLDNDDLEPEESDLLVRGKNEFRIVTKHKLSEPLRIVGGFLVAGAALIEGSVEDHKFELEKAFPFFSGTVTYQTELDLEELPARLTLDLDDVYDSAVVYVNGELAGKRLWPPYRVDITHLVRLGSNDLKIEVRNNLANMIQGRPRPFGLRSQPTLEFET